MKAKECFENIARDLKPETIAQLLRSAIGADGCERVVWWIKREIRSRQDAKQKRKR